MTWQVQHFNWSASAQTIQGKSEQVLGKMAGIIEQAAHRLTPLADKVSFNRHALSAEAANLLALRGELDDLLCQGHVLSAHPYLFLADNVANAAYHLTPANAVQHLADKLLDSSDDNRPTGPCYALGLMIAEQNLPAFGASTKAVFDVLALPELGMVARRAGQGLTLEQDKFTQPLAAKKPLFRPASALNSAPLRQVLNWQGAQVAQLESIAADRQTPIVKLQALSMKRTAHLTLLHDAIESLKQSAIQVRVFSAEGSPEVLNAMLQQSIPPGYEHTHTFAALLLSQTPLTFISELFV
ncbi:hypothetical protein [Moritella sp. Urea-trap-13]|uniref:hypothetical protein n=1 Tax=Moritella sp. Urea-trap-13 TaxID=2058327 RepID=UPI000C31C040|nr:hypothetical protein [Moritella sp. Urea-trap-13]PKH06394.1 hypothetical protein CXF93_10790 [Moritella sp. Urea-trap-13]